jgi:hypothetical protein
LLTRVLAVRPNVSGSGFFSAFKPSENIPTNQCLSPPSKPKALNFYDAAYGGKSRDNMSGFGGLSHHASNPELKVFHPQ